LEVDLGYDTDVFTSLDGTDFWTRPIYMCMLTGGLVPIRYITASTQDDSPVKITASTKPITNKRSQLGGNSFSGGLIN
jgi:hypothetical protein